MKFVKLALLIASLAPVFGISTSWASELCTIKKIESPHLKGRGWKIEFPNGLNFQVVGHEHGERRISQQILTILGSNSPTTSEVRSIAQTQRQSLAKTLEHFAGDARYLVDHLSTGKKDVVVWVEASESFMQETKRQLAMAIRARGSDAALLKEEFLLASGSPPLYLDVFGKLPNSAKLKGIENLSDEIQGLWRESDSLKANSLSFQQIESAAPTTFKAIRPLIIEWGEMLGLGKAQELYTFEQSRIDALVERNNFPPAIVDSLKKRLKAYWLDDVASLKRDEQNTQRMVSEGKSGIFFVGYLHLQPSMYLLKSRCEAMLKLHSAPQSSSTGDARTMR